MSECKGVTGYKPLSLPPGCCNYLRRNDDARFILHYLMINRDVYHYSRDIDLYCGIGRPNRTRECLRRLIEYELVVFKFDHKDRKGVTNRVKLYMVNPKGFDNLNEYLRIHFGEGVS